ncbi:hypothetical protein GMORB2_0120 [Geosmithia morbida]|uniref:Transmembrane protein n=1 Tax=Geosmithia morbida TaxID=1094350 RepID=A0A9P4Z2T3_9HYPO|nr:uncharacterized protein GMORB2_0120 [Geosmithia morbida]KAF4126384.1 hypothetical protein GMORB2_0120 [Geosmithia morbida]
MLPTPAITNGGAITSATGALLTLSGSMTTTTPQPGHDVHHHHHHHHHHYHQGERPHPAILGLVFGVLVGFIAFATTFQMVRCACMVREWRRQRRMVACGVSEESGSRPGGGRRGGTLPMNNYWSR